MPDKICTHRSLTVSDREENDCARPCHGPGDSAEEVRAANRLAQSRLVDTPPVALLGWPHPRRSAVAMAGRPGLLGGAVVTQVGAATEQPSPDGARPVAVRIDGVSHEFSQPRQRRAEPVTALRDIQLDIAPQTFVSIVGPSGCG